MVVLTGLSGVGKTSVARVLSEKLGYHPASVGDFLRFRSKTELGHEAPEEAGAKLRKMVGTFGLFEAFVNWADLSSHEDVIVDGVRSAEGVEALARLLRPTTMYVVELVAPPDIRRARLLRREKLEGRVCDFSSNTSALLSLDFGGELLESVTAINAAEPLDRVIKNVIDSLCLQ